MPHCYACGQPCTYAPAAPDDDELERALLRMHAATVPGLPDRPEPSTAVGRLAYRCHTASEGRKALMGLGRYLRALHCDPIVWRELLTAWQEGHLARPLDDGLLRDTLREAWQTAQVRR